VNDGTNWNASICSAIGSASVLECFWIYQAVALDGTLSGVLNLTNPSFAVTSCGDDQCPFTSHSDLNTEASVTCLTQSCQTSSISRQRASGVALIFVVDGCTTTACCSAQYQSLACLRTSLLACRCNGQAIACPPCGGSKKGLLGLLGLLGLIPLFVSLSLSALLLLLGRRKKREQPVHFATYATSAVQGTQPSVLVRPHPAAYEQIGTVAPIVAIM
jgi:hypothetical protein